MSCEYCNGFVKNESCWRGFQVANLLNLPLEIRSELLGSREWSEGEKQFTCFCSKCYAILCCECIQFISCPQVEHTEVVHGVKEFSDIQVDGFQDIEVKPVNDFPEMEE